MAERLDLLENLTRIREKISVAAAKSGRDQESVLLVAVTKSVEPKLIQQAVEAGVKDIGENYLQEALLKKPEVTGNVRWHFIGHLQRNKVNRALDVFELIQSVDSLPLAEEIGRRSIAKGKETEVLMQINTSGEESKFGVNPELAVEQAEKFARIPGIKLTGLMTIGSFEPDPESARPEFKMLASLYRELEGRRLPGVELRWLSMGMTHDFEVAIEEGANIVRVGRGIFGPRP